jgi:ethanolamine utilization protein EutQ (cupin superfamily)
MIFCNGDYNVLNIGLFTWRNTMINNFEKPRIKHGFSLITEGKFMIHIEDEIIEAVKGDLLFFPLN